MFFCLKYGNNQSSIFNLNCKVLNLLSYIRKVTKVEDLIEIDISDLSGDVKHLGDAKYVYATTLLKEKETYVLLKVERKHPYDNKPTYNALLNNEQIINEDFLLRLNSMNKRKSNYDRSRPSKGKTNSNGQIGGSSQFQTSQKDSRSKRNSNFSGYSNSLNASLNEFDPSPKPVRSSREFDFE